MPSPVGWREVPCVECGEFVPDIAFGERCPACFTRRSRRASRIARRSAMGLTLVLASWTLLHMPSATMARWYALIGIPVTYLLIHLIVRRIAMEALP
jgi:hypothetical protein